MLPTCQRKKRCMLGSQGQSGDYKSFGGSDDCVVSGVWKGMDRE